jgi:hypothetical protein
LLTKGQPNPEKAAFLSLMVLWENIRKNGTLGSSLVICVLKPTRLSVPRGQISAIFKAMQLCSTDACYFINLQKVEMTQKLHILKSWGPLGNHSKTLPFRSALVLSPGNFVVLFFLVDFVRIEHSNPKSEIWNAPQIKTFWVLIWHHKWKFHTKELCLMHKIISIT